MHSKSKILAITAGLLFAAAQAGALGTDAGTDITNTATVDYVVGSRQSARRELQHGHVRDRPARPPDRRRERRRLYGRDARRDRAGAGVHRHQRHQRAARLPVRRRPGHHRHHRGPRRHGRLRCHQARGDRRFATATASTTPGVDTADLPRRVRRGRHAHRVHRLVRSRSARLNGDTAGLTLTALAAEAGVGARSARTLARDGQRGSGRSSTRCSPTSRATRDIARDGKHSDDDAYRVQTATLAVTKTSTVISDPINGDHRSQAHPGRGDRVLRHGGEHRRRGGDLAWCSPTCSPASP